MLEEEKMKGIFEELPPRQAGREEIELIHTPSYFDLVASTAGRPFTYLDPDTHTSEGSFTAALYAAGAILSGIDLLVNKSFNHIFALIRPPGHHAEADMARGFCLFNNIAIGAMYAIEKHSIERILIVDWDIHHGNGTQHSFYTDPRALYFSTHQYPHYPGTGNFTEVGQDRGRGFTINVPLQAGNGDRDYYKVYKKILEPVADLYRPQIVLVSAGFDTYYRDPLGGMQVTPEGYRALTQIVQSIAGKHAEGRLLLALEGGYHLSGLCESVRAVIHQLAGQNISSDPLDGGDDSDLRSASAIERTISVQREFWPCF